MGRSTHHVGGPSVMRTFGGMAIAGVLIFGLLYLEVPARISDFGAKVMGGELAAPRPAGESVVVRGTDYRPDLEVTAGKLERTRSRTTNERAGRGTVLYAVPLRIRNRGDRSWNALHATEIALIDGAERRHPRAARFTKVQAGRALPRMASLAPGRTLRGRAVFEVPDSASVRIFEVKVGPGFAKVARWRVQP